MSTRVYTFIKDVDYTQVAIADNANTSVTYDLFYNTGKLVTVKDTNTEPLEKLITFSRDVNDEVQKIIDHTKREEYVVKQADNTQYNEFWKRPDSYTKISEFNVLKKIEYYFDNDRSVPEVNRTPISILREIGFDSINCMGTQAQINGISNYDTSIQIIPYYYDGKIQSVLGTNTNTPAEQWKVNFTYVNGLLDRMDEYSFRKDNLGRLKYIIDATFTFKYVGDRLQYILCTGTPYKRIDMQYNSVGSLVAVYKTTTTKSLWFKVFKNRLEYVDKSQVVYKFNEPVRITDIDMVIDNVPAKLTYNYDITKVNVNRFPILGVIAPDGSVINLCKFNLDMNGEQSYINSMDFEFNGIMYYRFVPNYTRGKIRSLDILFYPTMEKVGSIRYFYSKNKISQISTYYIGNDDTSQWFASFVYNRNPYNPKDRTFKVDHDYVASGLDKLGKWVFKLSDNNQVNDIFDHFGKIRVGNITYNKNNEPITCDTLVDSPVSTHMNDYKISGLFEVVKGGVL